MSMVICTDCGSPVDSDDDPECFVEVGNMRRLHKTEIVCERCRDLRIEQMEMDAAQEAAE